MNIEHTCTISLRFLGIILRVLRLEVSVYIVYITNQRGNSRTYTYVEVSGHNLRVLRLVVSTLDFCLSTRCYSPNLSFLHWSIILYGFWNHKGSILSGLSALFTPKNNKHGLDIITIGYKINLMSFKCQ